MPVPRFRHCRSGFITHRPEKRQTVSQGRHEASFELMSPLKRSQGLWGPHSGCAPQQSWSSAPPGVIQGSLLSAAQPARGPVLHLEAQVSSSQHGRGLMCALCPPPHCVRHQPGAICIELPGVSSLPSR